MRTRHKTKTDDLARRRFELMAAEHLRALGERIRSRREELGLTQEEVARRMPGKVAGTRVSLWERGKNRPHDDSLEQLAKALDTTATALLMPEPDKTTTPQPFPERSPNDQQERLAERLAAIDKRLAAIERALAAAVKHDQTAKKETEEATRRLLDAVDVANRVLLAGAPRSAEAPETRAT